MFELTHADKYFATARERYEIKLRRESGRPSPWTDDVIFQSWRFCQVHREHDKTTVWFRDNVRRYLSDLAAVEATLIFRMFNRIETGEIVTDLLLNGWDTAEARRRLKDVHPLVTGAYQIKTINGLNKLEGLLQVVDHARPLLSRMASRFGPSLRPAWRSLQEIPCVGPFHAYEIVSDLRWTPVLNQANDILTWANSGPGATHGLGLVARGDRDTYQRGSEPDQLAMRDLMIRLLAMSREERYWPQAWTPWEMRECEHWACEFAKYMHAVEGHSLKRRFAA